MSNVNIYSLAGKKQATLPKDFSGEANPALIAQAIRVYQDRSHPGLAKVKTRGEVRLSTRKIYRQKGTGGARHGAKSANLFVGGGVVHGPTGVKRVLQLPKKMKSRALTAALSLKAKVQKVIFVADVEKIKKTKDARQLIEKIITDQKLKSNTKFTLILSGENKGTEVIFKNLKHLKVIPFKTLNAYKVFYGGYLLFDEKCFPKIALAKKDTKKSNSLKKESVKDKK